MNSNLGDFISQWRWIGMFYQSKTNFEPLALPQWHWLEKKWSTLHKGIQKHSPLRSEDTVLVDQLLCLCQSSALPVTVFFSYFPIAIELEFFHFKAILV